MYRSPWSVEFVRNLLRSENPIHAVSDLANIWSSKPWVDRNVPYFGLLPCEYSVQLCLNYLGDVGNGGHVQYFSNQGEFASETVIALNELHFKEEKEVLVQAIAVFPDGTVPTSWEAREALIDELAEDDLVIWNLLDKKIFASSRYEDIRQFLLSHEAMILERECS